MASLKYLTFTKQSGTGNQSVTGVGFAGLAMMLWSTRQASTGATDGATLSLGMTDGLTQGTRFIRHPDNESATTSAQAERYDSLVYQTSATSGATPTVQNQATFVSFDADGFTLNWSVNDGTADIWHAIVFGGAMQAKYLQSAVTVGANADQTFTGVGFQPESFVVIGGAFSSSYNNGAPYGSIHGFGFSNASSNVCGWTVGFGTGGAATAYRGQHTDRVASIRVANLTGFRDTEICGLSITSTSADGFTLHRHSSNGEQPIQHILCLRGIQTSLGSFNARTSTGDHTLTLPFEPELLMLQSHNSTSATANDMALAMGAWQGGTSGATWIGGTNSANPSVYARSTVSSKILEIRTPNSTGSSSAVAIDATVASTSDSGAVINFATVSGTAVPILYMAFASSEAFIDGDPGPLVTVEMTDRSDVVHPWAEVDLNDADSYYGGYKAPRIVGLDVISRGLSDSQGQIPSVAFGVELSDTDRALRGLLEDPTDQYLVNCPLVVRTVSDDDRRLELPMHVEMSGYVSEFEPKDGFRFALSGVDWIKKKLAKRNRQTEFWQPLLTRDDFPLLASDKLNIAAPIVYGKVSDENGVTTDPELYPRDAADPGWREFGYNGWATGTLATQTYYAYCTTITNGVESTRYAFQLGFAANPSSPAFHVRLLESRTPDYFRFYLSDGADFEPITNPLAGTFARYIDVDPTTIPTTVNPYGGATGNRFFLIDSPTIGDDYQALVTGGGATAVIPPRGACPTIYVGEEQINDETWSAFLICRGAVKDVIDAFANGVRVTDYGLAEDVLCPFQTDYATEFGANYRDINGTRYTVLYARNSVALHAIQDPNYLTVNVWGIESTGDTSGSLLTSPLDVHQHFATNFLGSDTIPLTTWNTDASDLPVSTPCVNAASYTTAAAVLSARITGGYDCAGIIGAGGAFENALDVLGALQVCGDFDAGIDRVGRLMVSAEPSEAPTDATSFDDVLHISDRTFSSRGSTNQNFFNVVPFNHTLDYTGRTSAGWLWSGSVDDPTSITNYEIEQESPQLDLRFLRNTTTAGADTIDDVVQRRRLRYRHPQRTVTFEVPYLVGASVELGTVVRLTHVEGTGASGWEDHDVRVTLIETDLGRLATRFTGYDLQPIYDGLDDANEPKHYLNAETEHSVQALTEHVNAIGNGGIYQLTGDVTAGPGNGAQVATIANDAVTYAKIQNVSAASRLLGRGSASGSGNVEEITIGSNLTLSGTTLSASGASGGGAGATVYASAFASPPSSPASGDLWLPSDGLTVSRYSGSVWVPHSPVWPCGDPTAVGLNTWVNQGTSTISTSGGLLSLTGQKSGSSATPALRCYVKAFSGDKTITAGCFPLQATFANFSDGGLMLRNSSNNRIESIAFSAVNSASGGYVCQNYASATSFNSTPGTYLSYVVQATWFRITYTASGTAVVIQVSYDKVNWRTVFSGTSYTSGADQWGIYVNAQQNVADAVQSVFSLEEV